MSLVYIAHPVSAPTYEGIEDNLQRATRWLTWAYRMMPAGYHFILPWKPIVEALDDHNESDRQRGMAANAAILRRCDALWLLGGRISDGMAAERDIAIAQGLRVLDLTGLGPEPTGVGPALPCEYPLGCHRAAEWEMAPPQWGAVVTPDFYCEEHKPGVLPVGFSFKRLGES